MRRRIRSGRRTNCHTVNARREGVSTTTTTTAGTYLGRAKRDHARPGADLTSAAWLSRTLGRLSSMQCRISGSSGVSTSYSPFSVIGSAPGSSHDESAQPSVPPSR
jgi:hypothetical protein